MQIDEQQFYLMHYMSNAMIYAIDHCLGGRSAKSKLIEEPILSRLLEEEKLNDMSEEERMLQPSLRLA